MEAQTVLDTTETDLDLKALIEEALWTIDTVRVSNPPLEVLVKEGHAIVRGIVGARAIQSQVMEAVDSVPGLSEVTFELLNDDDLEYAAAHALATDSRTRSIRPGYRLMSHDGHIQVFGKFTGEETSAAKEVIKSVAGVRGVKVG
jgi:osmotically-inducible protein OsmY